MAKIRHMDRSFILSILPFVAASITSLCAQTPTKPSPSPPPATLRSVLLSQLLSTHDKAEWFTPMNTAVAGLTAEQAKWVPQNAQGKRDPKANHSVGMLTYHLVFWNENALARLHGEKPTGPNNNDETFNAFTKEQWTQTLKKLDDVLLELEKTIQNADEASLKSWAETISNISTHNAYHTGQIIFVRKLQGSWKPEKGAK